MKGSVALLAFALYSSTIFEQTGSEIRDRIVGTRKLVHPSKP